MTKMLLALHAMLAAVSGDGNLNSECKWDYNYKQEGADWGELTQPDGCNPSKNECGSTGPSARQSPLNFSTHRKKWENDPKKFTINYDFEAFFKGADATPSGPQWIRPHSKADTGTLHYTCINCTNMKITMKTEDGLTEEYTMIQMHGHMPSENKIDGKSFAGELHFVHQSKEGKLLVVGINLEEQPGEMTGFMRSFFGTDGTKLATSDLNKADWQSLWADSKSPLMGNYWNAKGSLTTPPCSEIVEWIYLETPLQISSSQYWKWQQLYVDEDILPYFARDTMNPDNTGTYRHHETHYRGKLNGNGKESCALG